MARAPSKPADATTSKHPIGPVTDPALTPGATQPATVLVVDDELLARQMFVDLLQPRGFSVVAISHGEDVFQWLDQADLVLLDAMLPGRDGWSICREIKDRSELLPVIMVTARTSPEDVVRTFDAGADDYIAKPFHLEELTARIESRLRVYRAERALQAAIRRLREMADQNYRLYEQARRDAEERTLLLRELDHRVRNNLSIIMGLVGMERNRRPARPTAEALDSLETRLRSFLVVYEALKRHGHQGVPIREIAEQLAQRLRNTLDRAQRIALDFSGEEILLDERQGFALALALNELLTNVFRHAFPDGCEGTLRLAFSETDTAVRIDVGDDGVGDRASTAPDALGSGRSIVNALIQRELTGEVERPATDGGTRVVLSFPRLIPAGS